MTGAAVRARLMTRIEKEGPLPLAEVMETALAHPTLGYYATRDPFGIAGDFITAPEISQMFGELIGLWAAVMWQGMGAPDKFVLVELGPGRGTLMADALRAARAVPGFAEAAQVHLVETSPTLRKTQAKTLSASGVQPEWHGAVDSLPELPMLLVANEFFDALPIHQLVRRGGGWRERLVGLGASGSGFVWTEATGDTRLTEYVDPLLNQGASDGDIVEICPSGYRIARSLGARLSSQSGACLVIDYGYALPACGDSLQAVRDHQYADVLATLGDADLTAHVDFTTLNRGALKGGAVAHPPVTQGAFLRAIGIGARAEVLMRSGGPEKAKDIGAQRDRLIHPSEMGTLFKAVAWTSSDVPVPVGF